MNRLRLNKNSLLIILLIVFIIFSFMVGGGIGTAFAATNTYSDVLDDLQQDSNFNVSDYVANEKDYSLNVIQIAESANNELFIYVFQPSGASKDLTAASVSLSTTTGENINPRVYSLSKLNSSGVFYKYKVNNFNVTSASTRYYNIVEIWRKWDSSIDSGTGNDNTINEVTNKVAQLWTVTGSGEEISYKQTTTEVVTITKKEIGFVRYFNGVSWSNNSSCDSHFIAFSCDQKMDNLLSANISFVTKYYSNGVFGTNEGDEVPVEKYIVHDTYASNEAGLFGKSYTWNRIQTASDFVNSNSSFSSEDKTTLSQYQWVLNFYETEYTQYDNALWLCLVNPVLAATQLFNSTGTVVSEVTILSLTFEVDGDTFTRGVVDNKQTGSINPINDKVDWKKIIAIVLGCIALIIVLVLFYPIISPVLSVIFKGIIWVITLPFKLIGSLFKGKDKK